MLSGAGRLSFKVINRYVQATGGFAAFGGLITIFVLQEAARIAATVWLSVWTSSNDATGETAAHHPEQLLQVVKSDKNEFASSWELFPCISCHRQALTRTSCLLRQKVALHDLRFEVAPKLVQLDSSAVTILHGLATRFRLMSSSVRACTAWTAPAAAKFPPLQNLHDVVAELCSGQFQNCRCYHLPPVHCSLHS